MKKPQHLLATIISLVLITFFAGPVIAQVWVGNYNIEDSDDIAALSGYTEVTGDLTIGYPEHPYPITRTKFENLEGLENLTSVGSLKIQANGSLTDISALSNLTSVRQALKIYYNNSLTNLNGLENLTSVGTFLKIVANNSLTSLSGLENLTSVGSSLRIDYNDALTSLSALSNLTNVGGDLEVNGNDTLTNLVGLEGLTQVPGHLRIQSNHALTRLNGLENLAGVGSGEYGGLNVAFNYVLTDLCALYDVSLAGARLGIYGNTLLSMDTAYALEAQMIYNGFTGYSYFRGNNGSVQVFCDNDDDTVYDDTDNCPNIANPNQADADSDNIGDVCDYCYGMGQYDTDEDDLCDGDDNCPAVSNSGQRDDDTDGVGNGCDNCPNDFNTDQTDSDNDGSGNVCDTVFNGDVIIQNYSDIASLEGYTEITGTLSIGSSSDAPTPTTLSTFEHLSGLESLTHIGGNLEILHNGALTSLCGLYNLNVGGDNLYIYNNTSLSMETSDALVMQLRNNGFTGPAYSYDNNGSGLVACDNGCNVSIVADKTVFDASGGEVNIETNSDCACKLFGLMVGMETSDKLPGGLPNFASSEKIPPPSLWIIFESGEDQCPETFSFSILENQGLSSRRGEITVGVATEGNPWPMYTRESFPIFQKGSPVNIDIKPSDCPNVLNRKSKGVIPIVIRGSEQLDVSDIDPESIRLMRTGDAGLYYGEVTPIDWRFEDVATKFQGEICDRVKLKNDEFSDLLLKFDNQKVFSSLGLDVHGGKTMTFEITGDLYEEFGGTTFSGKGSARINSKY